MTICLSCLTDYRLASNNIGGYYLDGCFISTPEGPKAIADALLVNSSLTKISLAAIRLREEGTKFICEALKTNTSITELNIRGEMSTSNIGGAAGAKHVADMLRVMGSLTSLDLSNNNIGDDGVKLICEALKQNSTLKVLDLNARHANGRMIGPQGARYLADMLIVNGSLTSVRDSHEPTP